MAVYVDEIQEHSLDRVKPAARKHGRLWAHLTADSRDELIRFAVRIGLSPVYMQISSNGIIHFDLTPSKRILAITKGALPITSAEMIEIAKRNRDDH